MDSEIILLIVSGVLLVVGAILWSKGNHLLTNGKKANAIIFKNNYSGSGSSGGVYYPVVRFLTDKQEWITQELNIGYSPPKPEGTKLEVLYDPDDPTNVEINSSAQLEFLPRLFVVLGIAGLIFGTLEAFDIIQLISD
ncbi:MAG TPA: DUF3592 domain-containing protein [Chryseolinea sp.]|nr:DUF3592 domain-containing protein [Chryseolinea sp.]